MIRLTRIYRFPAAHVLAQPAFSDEENRRIFGKCANPAGHGHDYTVEVAVEGPVDPETGHIIPLELLDQIFDESIREHYSHRMLNEVEPFGALVPTAENIARVAYSELDAAVREQSTARVAEVRVTETGRNHVVYSEDARAS
jgi:6-pyruvoyltetrahydropterin/6-carboxytetrahydropterin synthase